MREVSCIDRRDRQYDEDVDGVELAVDDRAIADVATKSQIPLDERRQEPQRLPLVYPGSWQSPHLDTAVNMCMDFPFVWRRGLSKKAQRQCMLVGISALQAGTPQHHMHVMGAHIVPDSLPEQFDHGLGPVGFQDAGAA